jgi:NAD(P)-dependent dehydrogenase (short-subunit alcohol dehydrogenase family)
MRSFLVAIVSSIVLSANAFAPVSFRAKCTPAAMASSSSSALAAQSDGGVVITGGAAGVGYAYAGEFMDRGYDVVICDVRDCKSAAAALTARHPNGKVFHIKCDVSDAKSVDELAKFAKAKLGTVGYWINNAGVNGGRRDLRDVPVSQVELVVKVNLLGVLLCTKAAMAIMEQQVSGTKRDATLTVFITIFAEYLNVFEFTRIRKA